VDTLLPIIIVALSNSDPRGQRHLLLRGVDQARP